MVMKRLPAAHKAYRARHGQKLKRSQALLRKAEHARDLAKVQFDRALRKLVRREQEVTVQELQVIRMKNPWYG